VELSATNKVRAAHQIGGYLGWHCLDFSALFGETTTIFRSSGPRSEQRLVDLWRKDCNVTRIDFQTTIWYSDNLDEIMREHYRIIDEHIKARAIKKKRLSQIIGNDGGHTIYIGKRDSDIMLRIYKKFEESKEPKYINAIRYEMEVKHKVGRSLGEIVGRKCREEMEVSPHTRGKIHANVAEQFELLSLDLPPLSASPFPTNGEQTRTDVYRKLEWLRTQVAPSIDWLEEKGYKRDALQALGLWGGDIGDGDIGY